MSDLGGVIWGEMGADGVHKLAMRPVSLVPIGCPFTFPLLLSRRFAGHITYVRTDGVSLAPTATTELRLVVGAEFGEEYLPQEPRVYKTKVKNAQASAAAGRLGTGRPAEPLSLSMLCPPSAFLYSWSVNFVGFHSLVRVQEAHEAIRPCKPLVTAEQLVSCGVSRQAALLYG